MVDTALDLFKRRQAAGRATVLVFYRGERSFFCKQWLRKWLSIPGFDRRLDLADVFLLFISSQSQGKAYSLADQIAGRKAILDTRVFFFGDPEHLLVDYLAESGLAHPVVTNPDSHRAHGWVFDYGMVQPAVLAIAADASVLYEWTSKPSLLNVAGKLDRPDPWDVWDKIEQRIDRIRITKARAVRRAIATGSSAVSTGKEGSTISSDGQSQPNTPDAHTSTTAPDRAAPKDSSIPNAAQLSLKSLTNAQQIPIAQSESPVPIESSEKEPKSAEDDREDESKSTLPPHQQQGEGEFSPSDTFSSAGGETNLPKASSDGEATTAPPSTAVDTLTADTLKTPLSQEERDSSEDDMRNTEVQQLSASINALASEVLAEKNLPLAEPEPETVSKLPKLAEEVVLSQHQAECLTDEELERDVEEVVDNNAAKGHNDTRRDGSVSNVNLSIKDSGYENTGATEKEEQTTAVEVQRQADGHVVRFTEHTERERLSKAQPDEFIGATETVIPAVQSNTVDEDPSRDEEDVDKEVNTSDALEVEPTASKGAISSVSFETLRTSDVFDAQGSTGDTLETSAASLGSDQVDSTAVIVKHPSVRTEDSAQVNSLAGFEGSSFPSERRIPEEADDTKTGISDYLKELKDPSKLNDPRYRSRYDPLPPIKPTGRNDAPSSSNSRPRPTSMSGYSYTRATNDGANSGLAQGLIQQETNKPPSEASRRDSSRRARESRLSQRIAPPVAVYVADTEPATPPQVATTRLNGQSPDMMPASPHPEVHNLTGTGTVDISPFADADHEMTMPEDVDAKASLRDEYEAYDEYIVCEYEVEEYVEEYESDTFSRSKVFVTTVVDDSSQDSQSMRTASEGRILNEVRNFENCNVVDVKGTAREADPEGRVRVWKESGTRRTAAVSPTIEANMTHRQAGAHPMSPVQVLLRKIGVRGSRRARASEEASLTDAEAQIPTRDPSRISRKDTLRSVLRKTPRDRVSTGDVEETMEVEEEEAKLGRKETIKSVLRKIPVPKTLKRTQTEETVGTPANEERPTTPVQESGGRSNKRGGLQAVLQRLPSLSGTNRHRGGVKVEMMSPVTSINEIIETNDVEEGQEQERNGRDRGTTPMSEEVEGEKPGMFKRAFSRLAQIEESDTATGTGGGSGTGATAGGSGALEERRKVRWGEDGEKVGGKMSFAVVGGRILSKFKM